MERKDMSAMEILEAYFEAYRNRDLETIATLCGDDITYVSPEGLVAENLEGFSRLIKAEFNSFGVLYEPLLWQSSIEKSSECLLLWKRGVKLARNAAFRRVEIQGSTLLIKSKGIWKIVCIQYFVPVSFKSLLSKKK